MCFVMFFSLVNVHQRYIFHNFFATFIVIVVSREGLLKEIDAMSTGKVNEQRESVTDTISYRLAHLHRTFFFFFFLRLLSHQFVMWHNGLKIFWNIISWNMTKALFF